MPKHLKIKTPEDNLVHFESGNSYTLCGLETDGDSVLGLGLCIETKQKVNCDKCLEIVEYCRTIKNEEMARGKFLTDNPKREAK